MIQLKAIAQKLVLKSAASIFFSPGFVKTLFFSPLFSAVNFSKNLRFSGQ